jgi:signal transduction histidine kinase
MSPMSPSDDHHTTPPPADQDLLERWELLRSLVDASPDLMWTVDARDYRLLAFNEGLRAHFASGWGVVPRLGMPLCEQFPERELEGRWRSFYDRAVAEGELHVCEFPTSVSHRTLDLRFRLLRKRTAPYAIAVFARDVTLAAKAEAELRASERQRALLAARLHRVSEEEKTRLSQDLHGRLGQLLTRLNLDLVWIEERLEELPPSPELGALLDRAVAATELAEQTIGEVQRLATELRPASLDCLGVGAAFRHEGRRFQQRSGITCRVELAEPLAPLAPDGATALYRIVQEALTNVERHARASEALIRLSTGPSEALLVVEDDGIGINPVLARAATSLGLAGMRERAAMEGGELVVRRRPEGGTRVEARLPLAKDGARP